MPRSTSTLAREPADFDSWSQLAVFLRAMWAATPAAIFIGAIRSGLRRDR